MTTQLKAELEPLEGKIHAFMAKDMLKSIKEGLKAEGKAMRATEDKEIAELKVAMYDTQEEMLCKLDPCDLDMQRMAQDAGDVIEYGTHFLALGNAHGLLIYKRLP
ncbi:hypothetical protein L7F22_003461 [Adiantum nelumboides]|nr:hypothetical protein [Adiantum nelumboides]